jgi:hypothetical protein
MEIKNMPYMIGSKIPFRFKPIPMDGKSGKNRGEKNVGIAWIRRGLPFKITCIGIDNLGCWEDGNVVDGRLLILDAG